MKASGALAIAQHRRRHHAVRGNHRRRDALCRYHRPGGAEPDQTRQPYQPDTQRWRIDNRRQPDHGSRRGRGRHEHHRARLRRDSGLPTSLPTAISTVVNCADIARSEEFRSARAGCCPFRQRPRSTEARSAWSQTGCRCKARPQASRPVRLNQYRSSRKPMAGTLTWAALPRISPQHPGALGKRTERFFHNRHAANRIHSGCPGVGQSRATSSSAARSQAAVGTLLAEIRRQHYAKRHRYDHAWATWRSSRSATSTCR